MGDDKSDKRLSVLETEMAVLKNELKHIREDLQNFHNAIQKILWIFTGGIIAALVSFVVKGGLVI